MCVCVCPSKQKHFSYQAVELFSKETCCQGHRRGVRVSELEGWINVNDRGSHIQSVRHIHICVENNKFMREMGRQTDNHVTLIYYWQPESSKTDGPSGGGQEY